MGSYNQAREGYDPRYYRVNENGTMQVYSRRDLDNTDYLSQRANEFITESGPFFLVVATNAPHEPAYVAERYRGEQRSLALPKPPSFDEADVRDKPRYVRAAPRLSDEKERELRRLYRRRAGSLKAVDDLVASLVKTLGQTGGLDNNYIVFTSDNGYLLGEHRLDKKQLPYEEAIRVPLVVRGPGVEQGRTRTELVANVDWAPSILDWASESASGMDGRSLAPLLSDTPIQSWRKRLLVESFPTKKGPPAFRALRTNAKIYVEYGSGFQEFYDLSVDPYQLENSYSSAGPALISKLSTRLAALKDCSGDTCREAEGP